MEWWEKKGKEAYRVLGECVVYAIEDENAEMAVICGYPLLKMAEVEKGSFFGDEGYWNYNRALDLAREAVRLAEKEGVVKWMESAVEDMKKTLKKGGWMD